MSDLTRWCVRTRGYHPTCRSLHHMMWMYETVIPNGLSTGHFLDVGSYVGACTFHMASLGYNVISVEGFLGFVDTMMATMEVNPSFHNEVEVHYALIGSEFRTVKGSWWHAGSGNDANSAFVEKDEADSIVEEMVTLSSVVKDRRLAVGHFNCQGCELAAFEGSEELLKTQALPMFKMYYNPVVHESLGRKGQAHDVLHILHHNDYIILKDIFPEHDFYYGAHSNEIYDVDRLFGSRKFNIPGSEEQLVKSARELLLQTVDHDKIVNQRLDFTDVVVIAKPIYQKLVSHFFPEGAPAAAQRALRRNETTF